MFCKCLIALGRLAAFSVQEKVCRFVTCCECGCCIGYGSYPLDTRTVELRGLGELIDQARELIKNRNEIIFGVLAKAVKTLKGFIDIIKAIKEKFLNQGRFHKGVAFISSKIEEAGKLGINITKCTAGTHEQLVDLATGLTGELSDCVSKQVSDALEMTNNDLKIIGEITTSVSNLPTDLSKCPISRNPISCGTNMVSSLTKVVANLPGQIGKMVEEVTTLVKSLPETLGECSNRISVTINSKVNAMINEVSKCVNELMP